MVLSHATFFHSHDGWVPPALPVPSTRHSIKQVSLKLLAAQHPSKQTPASWLTASPTFPQQRTLVLAKHKQRGLQIAGASETPAEPITINTYSSALLWQILTWSCFTSWRSRVLCSRWKMPDRQYWSRSDHAGKAMHGFQWSVGHGLIC